MTPHQIRLARHTLGLPNNLNRAYRNRFFAVPGTPDHAEWRAMVDAGFAMRVPWATSLSEFFFLTGVGAAQVIEPGEGLCPEDFPK